MTTGQGGVISRTKTQGKELGQVVGSTGSMWYTSDDRSDMVTGHKTKKVRPRSGPGAGNTGCEVGSTLNQLLKVPTMAKSTRGTSPHDRVTRISGVKITPPTAAAPAPSTHSLA